MVSAAAGGEAPPGLTVSFFPPLIMRPGTVRPVPPFTSPVEGLPTLGAALNSPARLPGGMGPFRLSDGFNPMIAAFNFDPVDRGAGASNTKPSPFAPDAAPAADAPPDELFSEGGVNRRGGGLL